MFSDGLSDAIAFIVDGIKQYREYQAGKMYPKDEVIEALSKLIFLRLKGDTADVVVLDNESLRGDAEEEAEERYNQAMRGDSDD